MGLTIRISTMSRICMYRFENRMMNFVTGGIMQLHRRIVSTPGPSFHAFRSSTASRRPSSRDRSPPLVLLVPFGSLKRDPHDHPITQKLAENCAQND